MASAAAGLQPSRRGLPSESPLHVPVPDDMANLSAIDRVLRLILAAVVLELAFFWLGGGLRVAAYLAGAILLGTSTAGFCPAYKAAGVSSVNLRASRLVLITAVIVLLAVVASDWSHPAYPEAAVYLGNGPARSASFRAMTKPEIAAHMREALTVRL